MKYREADIEALKAPDIMRAYCDSALGTAHREGQALRYPCPYGAHTRPKLEVGERDGKGVAHCWACNKGGTVYNIAAAVLGVDPHKDFLRCVEEVAEKTGYHLTEDTARRRPHSLPRGAQKPRLATAAPPPSAAPVYLPPEQERAALEAVKRAHENPRAMESYAAKLNLPPAVLQFHTDIKESSTLGLLGLNEAGRLVYVYTAYDSAGEMRIQSTKTRNAPGTEPRFIQRGSQGGLWGAAALQAAPCRRVIITEGESDCLAVRAAIWSWLDLWAHDDPDSFPPAESWPAVVAKPSANTFKQAWANPLRGKDVILTVDSDTAGKDGAARTADLLRAAGAFRVFAWNPPAPLKDARAALDPARPWLLADSIMTSKTLLQ